MSFRTAEPNLKDVLADIHNGIIQLPDFQREWVWDDRHILELIASVSLSFPIGAVMFLEAGGVPFQTRLFEGVELSPAPAPKKLVLDGQQRLTSMYLALYSGKPVKTKTDKGEKAQRVYFLDMEKCLDPHVDRENAHCFRFRETHPRQRLRTKSRTGSFHLGTAVREENVSRVPAFQLGTLDAVADGLQPIP